MRRTHSLFAGALFVLIACGGASRENTSELGAIQVALKSVPPAVGCVSISVVGSRTVVQEFAVTPGQSSVLSMDHLPQGGVSVSGAAYDGACTSPLPEPTWVADAVSADLQPGRAPTIPLKMHPHQRAQMEIDFDPDAGGAPPPSDAGASADAAADSAPVAGTFVDQYNGAAAGGFVVSMSTHVTQTITAGLTGQLTLVEIGVGRMTATNGQRLRLNVRDGAALLGSAILPASSLPQGYGYNVQFGSRGPGLFDLRASNIRVTAGHTYQLELEGLDIIDTGTCVRSLCSNDPNTVCTASDECTRYAEFGVTVSTADPYAGGAVTATGPFGTLVRPDVDFTFATIVQTP